MGLDLAVGFDRGGAPCFRGWAISGCGMVSLGYWSFLLAVGLMPPKSQQDLWVWSLTDAKRVSDWFFSLGRVCSKNKQKFRPLLGGFSSLTESVGDLFMTSGDLQPPAGERFEMALIEARRGEQSELGVLLDLYRGYLTKIAVEKLSPIVATKLAPSDVVQETLLRAAQGFREFRGTTEQELRAWLTKILENYSMDMHQYYRGYAKRDVSREVPFDDQVISGAVTVAGMAEVPTPSSFAHAAENAQLLARAMEKLDEDQRQVIQFRNFDQLSFEEIGERLGRSADAACKLWGRAVQKLAKELRQYGLGPD